tara:strand:- start:1063 stop:1722 length:660 start_codon:yes stop_codon:yes gene_type:complete
MIKSKSKKNTKRKTKKQKNNNILKEYYEWEGQELWIRLNKKKYDVNRILNQITKKYNNNNQQVELIKTDTGIIVIILKNIVIKIYNENKYNKIKDIIGLEHPNIERKIKHIKLKDLYFVISEKIIPILIDFEINPILNSEKIKNDKEIIKENINNALDEIDELGFVHGDTRLDNIGVKINENKYTYILFDFGATNIKQESVRNTNNDRDDLLNSIKKFL